MEYNEIRKIESKISNPTFLQYMSLAESIDEQREICEFAGIIKKGDESAFRVVLKLLESRKY